MAVGVGATGSHRRFVTASWWRVGACRGLPVSTRCCARSVPCSHLNIKPLGAGTRSRARGAQPSRLVVNSDFLNLNFWPCFGWYHQEGNEESTSLLTPTPVVKNGIIRLPRRVHPDLSRPGNSLSPDIPQHQRVLWSHRSLAGVPESRRHLQRALYVACPSRKTCPWSFG